MNQNIQIKLEILRDGRPYEFIIRPGFEWTEIQDVLNEFKLGVEQIRAAQEAASKPAPIESEATNVE